MTTNRRHGVARTLSKLGLASRTTAAGWVRDGRVAVNGQVVRDPEFPVRQSRDQLCIDGQPVVASERIHVMLNKPRGLVDACYTEGGEAITDTARCRALFPVASNPRLVAGMPFAHDRLKCALKPVDVQDYARPLTAAQLASLGSAFPEGVCDFSRPGVAQQAPETWLTFPLPEGTARAEPAR